MFLKFSSFWHGKPTHTQVSKPRLTRTLLAFAPLVAPSPPLPRAYEPVQEILSPSSSGTAQVFHAGVATERFAEAVLVWLLRYEVRVALRTAKRCQGIGRARGVGHSYIEVLGFLLYYTFPRK